MANLVKFDRLHTQAFAQGNDKNADTIYFSSDTNQIILGGKRMGMLPDSIYITVHSGGAGITCSSYGMDDIRQPGIYNFGGSASMPGQLYVFDVGNGVVIQEARIVTSVFMPHAPFLLSFVRMYQSDQTGETWSWSSWETVKYDFTQTLVDLIGSSPIGSATQPIYWTGSALAQADAYPTLASLMGASAIGSATQPLYWNGSAFVTANSYPVPGDGKLSIKGGTTEIASFTANQSTNVDFSIVAGTNISVTPDATNHKVTIANTYSYSLPSATSSILGGVKLGSDDIQLVAAGTPSSAASRTYPIQVNSSGQMVVNVPWTDSTATWEGE